ncbi:hypothetical protein BOSE21B_10639 [Bosea sp. 21B]|nr:hypothetical protein BOSE21B_10639 [Bosea sp. 21B]
MHCTLIVLVESIFADKTPALPKFRSEALATMQFAWILI